MLRLLVAEDEKALSRVLFRLLKKDYEVIRAYNGPDALEVLLSGGCDLALMDIMMPGIDGLEVLRRARERHVAVPVLLLTALSETDDKVAGLDGGANDYLTKPFESPELKARLRCLARQCEGPEPLRAGDTALDRKRLELSGPAGELPLSPPEAGILAELIIAGGRPCSGARLAQAAGLAGEAEGERRAAVYTAFLDGKMRELRCGVKIAECEGGWRLLEAGNDPAP